MAATSWRIKIILFLLMGLLLVLPPVAWAEGEKEEDKTLWEEFKSWFTDEEAEKDRETSGESISGNLGDHFINGLIPDTPKKVGRVEAIYSKPLSNYQLDLYVEDTYFFELIDSASNSAAMTMHGFNNGLWTIALMIAKGTLWIRQEALTLDLVEAMNEDVATSMEKLAGFDGVNLHQTGIVGLMLPFMILGAGLWAGWKVYLEDDTESVKRGLLTSALVILMLFAFISYASTIMTKVNSFTMTLRNLIMAVPANLSDPSLENPYTIDEAIVQSNNNTWKVMADNDFRMMTWGTLDVPEKRVNAILNHSQNSEARKKAVIKEGQSKEDDGYGNVNVTPYNNFYRFFFLLLWVIPKNIVVGAIHVILSAAILLFQLMFMLFYWLGAVAIIWAVIPSLRQNLDDWAAETVGAALMGFGIGVFMAVFNTANDLMYEVTADKGYLSVIGGQILVTAFIIWKRGKIFDWSTGMILKLMGSMSSPQLVNGMMDKGLKLLDPGYHRRRRRRKQRDNFYRNADPGPGGPTMVVEDEKPVRPTLVELEEIEKHPEESTSFEFDPRPALEVSDEVAAAIQSPEPRKAQEGQLEANREPVLLGAGTQEPPSEWKEAASNADRKGTEPVQAPRPRLMVNEPTSKQPADRPTLETAGDSVPLEPQVPPKRPSLEVDDETE